MVVGDLVSCHARIVRETTRSLRVAIEVRARRRFSSREVKVTDGTFVYVAIDTMGRPRPLGTAKDVGMAKSSRSRSP